jgi:hypothetical protein
MNIRRSLVSQNRNLLAVHPDVISSTEELAYLHRIEQLEKENKRLYNIIKEQQSIIIKYGNFETGRNSRRANEAYASTV